MKAARIRYSQKYGKRMWVVAQDNLGNFRAYCPDCVPMIRAAMLSEFGIGRFAKEAGNDE